MVPQQTQPSGGPGPDRVLEVSIIIVSFNTRKLVEDCLLSLERHLDGVLDYEAIVVDNASSDGTPAWLEGFARGRPRVRVRLSSVNTGFSGGNNLGFAMARGRYQLMLNSDAYLIDGSLAGAVAYLDAHPDLFALAGLLYDGEGRPGPSYGHFPSPWTLFRELARRRYGSLRAVCPGPEAPTRAVDFPCGAFYLIRSAMLRELGGMDEGFFVYFEETDLARRARDRGWGCVYHAPTRAVHLGGQSIQEVKSPGFTRMFYANWKRYLGKHHSALGALAVRAMLRAYFSLAAAAYRRRGNARATEFFRVHLACLGEGWRGEGLPKVGRGAGAKA